jgi:DNA end-binding protein Ku
MARPVWSGSISFGLVSIPVSLYTATADHTIHFHQYERDTADRIRYQRVNERSGEEVDFEDIVKGRDVDGKLVLVEPGELDEIAPGRSRSLEIETFVELADIDPLYFQKTYWLAPAKADHQRPYELLLQAMEKTGRAGIATFVMRGKQYLTAVRADENVLALETLYFADEVRKPSDVLKELPSRRTRSGKDLDLAVQLVESMGGEWSVDDYQDTYTAKVETLIRNKAKGRKTKPAAPQPAATEATDLLEALRNSVKKRKKTKKADLSELSKKDLLGMARELEIPGRSSMSRAELERAVGTADLKQAS